MAERKTPKLLSETTEPAPTNDEPAEPARAPLKLGKKSIQVDNPKMPGADPNSVENALERNLRREQAVSQADYAEDHRRFRAFVWKKRMKTLCVLAVLGAVNGAVWFMLHKSGANPIVGTAAAIVGGGFSIGVLLYLWVR